MQLFIVTALSTLVFLLSHQSTGLAKKACHNSCVVSVLFFAAPLPVFLTATKKNNNEKESHP